MSPRSYTSALRDKAAEETRARIIADATRLLLSEKGAAGFSSEAVARSARVARLTVYNRFGSRRALLEAVFDERARQRGLFRMAEALAAADPRAGLKRLIAVFCEFWAFDEIAIARVLAAGSLDPDFAESIRLRNERRRKALAALVVRIAASADSRRQRELVDVLFALTGHAFFAELRPGERSPESTCTLIEHLAFDAVDRTVAASARS